MKMVRLNICVLALALLCVGVSAQKPVATVASIEGKASMLRGDSEEWREVRVGMPLKQGDQLFSHKESFVELRYAAGAVVRLNENTKIVLREGNEQGAVTEHLLGDVWVNMKKISSRKGNFDMVSPTAVASIRGTSYHMSTAQDSSTDVNVYNGTVAVGPSAALSSKMGTPPPPPPPRGDMRTEIPGPEEIPGPFEVPLDQWVAIVAGQRISVRPDGRFAQAKFDPAVTGENSFIKRNRELDAQQ
jgi:hypothetical protein